MKRILRFFICVWFITALMNTAHAQTEVDIDPNGRSYSEIFDSLSTGLVSSRIPYGTLYDRVFGWSGLDTWQNGDTLSVSRIFQSRCNAHKFL